MPSSTSTSASTTAMISDNNSLKDKVGHANVLTYVVIALACILGLMVVLFVVCKIRNNRKKNKAKEMRRLPTEKPRPRQTINGAKSLSPRQIHPRINQLKKEELFFTRSDSGYTSNQSTPRNKRSRKQRDSRGMEVFQNEAWGDNPGKPRAKPSPKVRGPSGIEARSQTEMGEAIEMLPVQKPGRQLSLVDNLDF